MNTSSKARAQALVCSLGLLLAASSASADWTARATIANVWQYAAGGSNSGNTYIYLNGAANKCTAPGKEYFTVKADGEPSAKLLSVLLAAQLSGRDVTLGWSLVADHCQISSVRLY